VMLLALVPLSIFMFTTHNFTLSALRRDNNYRTC
jgi:hypothetical protein